MAHVILRKVSLVTRWLGVRSIMKSTHYEHGQYLAPPGHPLSPSGLWIHYSGCPQLLWIFGRRGEAGGGSDSRGRQTAHIAGQKTTRNPKRNCAGGLIWDAKQDYIWALEDLKERLGPSKLRRMFQPAPVSGRVQEQPGSHKLLRYPLLYHPYPKTRPT